MIGLTLNQLDFSIYPSTSSGRTEKSLIQQHCQGGASHRHLRLPFVNARRDRSAKHVSFDISWDEVAKYVVATPQATRRTVDLINRYPDRFLFGTDEVAPRDQAQYLKIYYQYEPLWKRLTPEASLKLRKGNYEHLFDEARRRVRAWERANVESASVRERLH